MIEQLGDARAEVPAASKAEQAKRPRYRLLDGVLRIERVIWILKDDLYPAALVARPLPCQRGEGHPVEDDGSAGGRVQPGHTPCDGRLTAPGLTDQRQALPLTDGEGHSIGRYDDASSSTVLGSEAVRRQQRMTALPLTDWPAVLENERRRELPPDAAHDMIEGDGFERRDGHVAVGDALVTARAEGAARRPVPDADRDPGDPTELSRLEVIGD
jgi:hypothetical protein